MKDGWLKTYRNKTTVVTINGCPLKVEDIVAASLLGGLNLLLVGERGEGKTQILYDVLYGIFGGRGTYVRVSPDMEVKEIYTALNLEKLREKEGTTEDIVKIVEQAKNPFTAIDELNRAPPIVQNQLLNILDGYIEVKGRRYELGVNIGTTKYHVGIATVNLGDRKYLGTFGSDVAILDRFGIVLDLDYYPPQVEDLVQILTSRNPKHHAPELEDRSEEIFKGYKEVTQRKVPFELLLVLLYLRMGIDYISVEPYSQRKTYGIIPEGAHESGGLQKLMEPISIRAMKNAAQLYRSLTYVAELHGYPSHEDFYFLNALESLKLILPYSGCLKPELVTSRYYKNPMLATEDIIRELKRIFEENIDKIISALNKKKKNALTEKDIESFDGEWEFFLNLLMEVEV
jgi:hypothetical protein